MASKRFTQDNEDATRLPEHMVRVGYDADTSQYTFRDSHDGTLYTSEPGSEYGTLHPVAPSNTTSRPQAFEEIDPESPPSHEDLNAPKTFQEFLPPSLMTSPSAGVDQAPKRNGVGSKLFRRSTLSPNANSTFNETRANGSAQPSATGGHASRHTRHRSDDISHRGSGGSAPDNGNGEGSWAPTRANSKIRKAVNISGVVQNLKRSVSSAVQRKKYPGDRESESSRGSAMGSYLELDEENDDKALLVDKDRLGMDKRAVNGRSSGY